MKTLIILILTGLLTAGAAAPSTYDISRLDGATPTIDGDLSDWPAYYFIDSIHSDNQVYARDALTDWTRVEYQMELYGACDDSWVYFAVKVIYDDVIITEGTSAWRMDNLKINPGGQAMSTYIPIDNNVITSPSSPFVQNSNYFGSVNPTGNGQYPTYEFSIQKDLVDPFFMNTFQLSIGSEDNDDMDYNNSCFIAVGAEYTGPKQDWNGNPWDNPLYYPTFNLTMAVEKSPMLGNPDRISLSASPNPFNQGTVLSYRTMEKGTLEIYDINGQLVRRMRTGTGIHQVAWNGTDKTGTRAACGVYIACLKSGDKTLKTKLFLQR